MAVRTRWFVALAGLLLGLGAAIALAVTSVPLYTAQTQLFVATTGSDNAADALQGSQFSEQRVSSYAQLLVGPVLARHVVDDLGLDMTPSALAAEVSASPVLDTVLIDVSVTDPSPERARDIAADLGARFPAMVDRLERPGGEGTSPVSVTVTRPPDRPTSPSSPKTERNAVLGALVGLLAGIALAIARAALDRSVRDPEVAATEANAPQLGVILREDRLRRTHVADLVQGTGAGEGYRQLRSNLQFLSVENPPKVVMVTSALPGEGKSTTTVNLAIALARAGRQVTVVEADLRRPKVASYLGVAEGAGLTSVITRAADIPDVLQPWGDDGLTVIAAGPIPPNPGELLGSSHMALLLDELREKNDFVLIDTPPLLPVADGTGLAAMVDGVLLCARYGSTRRDQLRQAREVLDRVGARTLGVILNAVPPRSRVPAASGYRYTAAYRGVARASR